MKVIQAGKYTLTSTMKSLLSFYGVYFVTMIILSLFDTSGSRFTFFGRDMTQSINAANPFIGLETMILIFFIAISSISMWDSNRILIANGYNRKTAVLGQSGAMGLLTLASALLNGLILPMLAGKAPSLAQTLLTKIYPGAQGLSLVSLLVLFGIYLNAALTGAMGSLILSRLGGWALAIAMGLGLFQTITGGLPDSFWIGLGRILMPLTQTPLRLVLTLMASSLMMLMVNLALNHKLPIAHKASRTV